MNFPRVQSYLDRAEECDMKALEAKVRDVAQSFG
jgi:hypothetical protein